MRKVCSLMVLIAVSAGAALAAEVITATSTGPMTVGLPYKAAKPRVFIRGGQGKWQPAQAQQEDGRLILQLDPAKLGGSTVTIMLDPPAGLVLDDDNAPVVLGLKLDGRGLPIQKIVELPAGPASPTTLIAAFTDKANKVDLASIAVSVDGRALPVTALTLQRPQPGQVRVIAKLPEMEYGKHEIAVSAADTSPQANQARIVVRIQRIDTSNVVLASLGAKITVDSSFPGYESLAPMNDGNTTMPGNSAGNDITWASAETDADHWAQVELPKPTQLKEVTVYWAAYTDQSHTPKHFEVQVPEGDGWRTLYKSPASGEKSQPVTTARFSSPVTTDRFRIFMPASQGSAGRPKLLWIGEIQAR